MPFEISPKFVEVAPRVGRYQHFADAMLRGCTWTKQAFGALLDDRWEWVPFVKPKACAIGAMQLALGHELGVFDPEVFDMIEDYFNAYGATPMGDNDVRQLSREQIAARIAAL